MVELVGQRLGGQQQSGPLGDPGLSGLGEQRPERAHHAHDAGSGFGIKVTGNTFTDLSGNVLQLQGENAISGLEINSTSMWDAFYGTNLSTWQTIASTWNMNIIRLPLNEWAWRTNATSAGGKAYQTIVATAVANITAAHMYVILDLHWASPNSYNNGVADGQPGYLDADNAVQFWSSVASAFKGNPAVAFELFNEPYGDDQSFDSTRLNLLKNGGAPPPSTTRSPARAARWTPG